MKGHLRERSPGHWAIVIDVRDPPSSAQMAWLRGAKRDAQNKNADRIAGAFSRQAQPDLGGHRLHRR
jgi:hypothetical protein